MNTDMDILTLLETNNSKHNFPTLYILTKNKKVLICKIKVEMNYGNINIIILTKYINSVSPRITKLLFKPKNTSYIINIHEQAVKKATSIYNDKIKLGYKTIEMIKNDYIFNNIYQNISNDLIDEFIYKYDKVNHDVLISNHLSSITPYNSNNKNYPLPLLAEIYQKKDDKNTNEYCYILQPKYNGVRCLTLLGKNEIIQYSREGEIINLTHLQNELVEFKSLIEKDYYSLLDGELYIHNSSLETIVSLYRLNNTESLNIKYYIFDFVYNLKNVNTFQREFNLIKEFLNKKQFENIILTDFKNITNKRDIENYFNKCIEDNYEGIMIRKGNSRYEFGRRNRNILKYKSILEERFKIIDIKLSTENKSKENFLFVCKNKLGFDFEVRPFGTIEERIDIFDNKEEYINTYLDLTFHSYTDKKIPFHIKEIKIIKDIEIDF